VCADLFRLRASAGALLWTTIATAGCVVEAGDAAPPPVIVEPGRLTLRWMVSEAVDPNLCVLSRSAAIDIAVSTTARTLVGEFQAPCTAFATSISSLYPGTYEADALLIDTLGRARTTNVQILPFTVLDRTELIIDVDFPADSFLDGLERDAVGRAAGAATDHGVASAPPAERSTPPDAAQPMLLP